MSSGPSWWDRLLGRNTGADIETDRLVVVPGGQSRLRAEAALPGTDSLEPLIELVPPPMVPGITSYRDPDPDAEYGPDPIAQWSLVFEADRPFDCAEMSKALSGFQDRFMRPTYFVRTPEGRTSYLFATDAPPVGIALISAWPLGQSSKSDAAGVYAGARDLAAVLAERPEGFTLPDFDQSDLQDQMTIAAGIAAIKPVDAEIVAAHAEGEFWSGRDIWNLLHQCGLRWGDMDSFQWTDPTGQSDYLIWAEVDDGDLGYALPERIAAGTQHFRAIRFSFTIARCPAPAHVLGQMERIAATCQQVLNCTLARFLDDTQVADPDDLSRGIAKVEADLARFGLKPGQDAVLRLI